MLCVLFVLVSDFIEHENQHLWGFDVLQNTWQPVLSAGHGQKWSQFEDLSSEWMFWTKVQVLNRGVRPIGSKFRSWKGDSRHLKTRGPSEHASGSPACSSLVAGSFCIIFLKIKHFKHQSSFMAPVQCQFIIYEYTVWVFCKPVLLLGTSSLPVLLTLFFGF